MSSNHLHRREMLALLAGVSGSLLLHHPAAKAALELEAQAMQKDLQKKGFILGDGPKEDGETKLYASVRIDQPGEVLLGNFAATEFKKIAVPFSTHSFVQYPNDKDQIIGIQKWGKNSVHMRIRSGKVTKLDLPKNTVFFGHGVFSPASDQFLVSAMNYEKGHGVFIVYDAQSLRPIDMISTYGYNPHEVQLSHDRKSYFVIHRSEEHTSELQSH